MNITFSFRSFVASLGLLVLFCCLGAVSQAQVSITGSSAIIDNLTGYMGTTTVPANWGMQGTGSSYAFRGNNQAGGTGGGWYGNNNMSFLGSGSAANGTGTWFLQNNTGVTITGFTLSFTARLWRSGTNSPVVTVSYKSASTSTDPAIGALDNPLANLSFSDATANITSGTTLTQTVSGISIAAGQYILIRFTHPGGSSSDNLGWDDVTFTPVLAAAATAPTVTSTRATAIAANGITAGGNVTSNGGATLTQKGVALGTATNPTSGTTTSGSGTGPYTTVITSLSPNTHYFYRAYAANSAGTGYGANFDTVTLAAAPDLIADNSSTNAESQVEFLIDENGNPNGTTGYTTQYAIKENTTNTWVQANGTLGATAVWQPYASWGSVVTGLNANTQYCLQVKARNNNNIETSLSTPACVTTAAATGTITGIAGTADVCNGNGATFNLTYTSTLNSGTYTAQLSNASGSFAGAATIGTGTSATTVSVTIPAGTTPGTGYRVRVVNSNIISDTTAAFSIKASPSGTLVAPATTLCPGQEATAHLTFNATAASVGPFVLSIKNVQANNTVSYPAVVSGTAFSVDASQVPGLGNTNYQLLQITSSNNCTNP